MQDGVRSQPIKITLPIILIAAVTQGWALFGLHHAVINHRWPATQQSWLIALYALAVFIPITLQMLAEHARATPLWRFIAVFAVAFFYFGWHHGTSVLGVGIEEFEHADFCFSFALLLTVLWLLVLPFVQSRLQQGYWAIQYSALFANAWRNKLVLAEAALFTGIFWLLLFLWEALFHLLKIDYFKDLFAEPIFFYPVTSLAFGCALHLIGSIDTLTSVVLEQLLNVLKWLGLVAGLILAFFTLALMFNLPELVFSGQKAIGATWLLWLIAVVVLLLNAAYRDGQSARPYPQWAAMFLRVVVPSTVIVSSTALYALMERSQYYGLTVERLWALVVAGAALLYSIGYSKSVFRKDAWLGSIAPVNVAVALALIAVIGAALTPLLSPYRLAADSQFKLIKERGLAIVEGKGSNRYNSLQNTPFYYLRFDSGEYGVARLRQLAEEQTGKDAEDIRRLAKQTLDQKFRWASQPTVDAPAMLAHLRLYPVGRVLDRDLSDMLAADLNKRNSGYQFAEEAVGIYIDLNNDQADEFVFLTKAGGSVYEKRAGGWAFSGNIFPQSPYPLMRNFDLSGELVKGNISAIPSRWNELSIGGFRFRVNEQEH